MRYIANSCLLDEKIFRMTQLVALADDSRGTRDAVEGNKWKRIYWKWYSTSYTGDFLNKIM